MHRKHIQFSWLCATGGFILIELMMAVALSVLIIAGVLSVYVSAHHAAQLQDAIAQNQADALSAIHILNVEIQKAGQIGCGKLSANFQINALPPYAIDQNNKLFATDDHSVHVMAMSVPSSKLLQATNDASDKIIIDDLSPLTFKQKLIIAGCTEGEIFTAAAVSHQSDRQMITPDHVLHHHYAAGSEVGELTSYYFYIAKTDRKNLDHSPLYALYVENINHERKELVEGISDMHFRYTIYENQQYSEKLAANVDHWQDVVGVDIDITVATWPITQIWHTFVALH